MKYFISCSVLLLTSTLLASGAHAETKNAKRGVAQATGNPTDCNDGQYFLSIGARGAGANVGKLSKKTPSGMKEVATLTCQKPAAQPRICCDIPTIDLECKSESGDYAVEVTTGGIAGITSAHLTQPGAASGRTLMCVAAIGE